MWFAHFCFQLGPYIRECTCSFFINNSVFLWASWCRLCYQFPLRCPKGINSNWTFHYLTPLSCLPAMQPLTYEKEVPFQCHALSLAEACVWFRMFGRLAIECFFVISSGVGSCCYELVALFILYSLYMNIPLGAGEILTFWHHMKLTIPAELWGHHTHFGVPLGIARS